MRPLPDVPSDPALEPRLELVPEVEEAEETEAEEAEDTAEAEEPEDGDEDAKPAVRSGRHSRCCGGVTLHVTDARRFAGDDLADHPRIAAPARRELADQRF